MRIKILITLLLLSFALVYLNKELNPRLIPHDSSNLTEKASTDNIEKAPTLYSPPMGITLDEQKMPVENHLIATKEERVNSNYQVVNPPFTDDELRTTEDIEKQFLSANNDLKQNGLARAFSYPKFSELLYKINEIPKSSEDYKQELQLREWVDNKISSGNHYENYACTGRLCFLELSNIDNINKDDLESISDFGNYISFMNYINDENLQGTFRAIYVKTDDISTLTIDKM